MGRNDVIVTLNVMGVKVPIYGIDVAVHEAGHALVACREPIEFELIELNASSQAGQGVLLARLLLTSAGKSSIECDPQLALRLAIGGPAAEFAYKKRQEPNLAMYYYFAHASVNGGWYDDTRQAALTLYPEWERESSHPPKEIWPRLQPRFESSVKSLEESDDLNRIIALANDLLLTEGQRMYADEVKSYFQDSL